MNKSRFPACLAAGLVLATLAGCGGGGGGGGGGGETPETPVVYDGNTNSADITATNAAGITANVMGSGSAPASVAAASIVGSLTQNSSSGLTHLPRRLNRSVLNSISQAQRTGAGAQLITAAIPVNQCDPCDSGSFCLAGTLSDSGIGELTVTYNGCRFGDETLSGSGTLNIIAFDLFNFVPTDSTVNFVRLKLRGPGISSDATVSSRLQVNLGTNTDMITSNIVTEDHMTNRKRKTEALVLVDVYDNYFFPSSFTETISGKVFHSDHGSVDVSTSMPLSFGGFSQLFPGSGQMRFTGSAGRSIRATALSATLLKVELDLDGKSVFENSANLKWTDLIGPVGADLGDTDGDGMHNSWETANGLNASNAADAALDNDGDSFSNLAEYKAGTDPNNAGSVPPVPVFEPVTATVINLPGVSDLIYDPVAQVLYATVLGNPGAIVPINPTTATVGTAISVGHDPVRLARSDDGQFLYVGLDGTNDIQRINLGTQTVSLTFSLGNAASGPIFADDIEVLPGAPQSIAISRRYKGLTPRHAGVGIYDNGVPRPNMTPVHTGSTVIEFSATAGTLYGYNNESTSFGFYRMIVDSSGISVQDVFTSFDGDLINGVVDIKFYGGLIYTTNGRVIDPVARTVVGTFFVEPLSRGFVVPDATIGRAFFLETFSFPNGPWSIRAFNLITRQFLGSVIVSGVTGVAGSFVRWGSNGLAFRTDAGKVYLIESATLIP